LIVCAPSTPADAKGLLKSAIRDDNPVVFLEGETIYGVKGEIADDDSLVPIGKARVARAGTDCTLVAWGRPYYTAMDAAERLAEGGIECEVIDPRTLRPLDVATIVASGKKTHRAVIVHEHWPYGGPGAEMVDAIQRDAFDHLDAPVLRVAGYDVPMPYAANLEDLVLPTVERVEEAVRKVCYASP
jgi:pyruvate dehydrogenase E1 component beta subunit